MTRYWIHMMIACLLLFSSCRKKDDKQFNERITLKQKHRIPYGTSAARELIPSLFPGTNFYTDDRAPGNWDVVSTVSSNQAVLLMAIDFNADEEELRQLNYFASNGNYVYIIAKSFSDEAIKFFNFSYSGNSFEFYSDYVTDSLFVKFEQPAFYNINNYTYPGKKFASSFSTINPNFAAV